MMSQGTITILLILLLPHITLGQSSRSSVIKTRGNKNQVENYRVMENIVKPYSYFHNRIDSLSIEEKADFAALFTADATIANDFETASGMKQYSSAKNYVDIMADMFQASNQAVKLRSPVVAPGHRGYICLGDHINIRVWIKKSFVYDEELENKSNSRHNIENWTTLEVVYNSSLDVYRIRKVAISQITPLDKNNDDIIDNVDCEDNNVFKQNFVPQKTERTRQPFGIIIGIAGGLSNPLGLSPYANRDVLDESTNEWKNGGMASLGLFANASIDLHFGNWFGIGGGVMGIYNPLDSARLEGYIRSYLTASNIRYNSVRVVRDSYRYNLIYFHLGVGNFNKGAKRSLKLEPTIAWADDGFKQNQMMVDIDYQQTGRQRSFSTVKTKPFWMYGASLKYEEPFGRFWGLFLAATYLTGTPKALEHGVSIKGNSSILVFRNNPIHVANIGLGLQFHIGRHDEGVSLR